MICIRCKKDRPHKAKGKCKPCYKLELYYKNREVVLARRRAKYATHLDEKRAYAKLNYARNKEKLRERNKQYRKKNLVELAERKRISRREKPAKYLLHSARRRAKNAGLPCTLKEEDITIPQICPVLGIELRISPGRVSANSPTLDRLDNKKGYTPNNVRVISYRANSIKSDATPEELEKVLAYAKSVGN